MSSKNAFDAGFESLIGYFKILAAVFVSSLILNFDRFSSKFLSAIPYVLILIESMGLFLMQKFGPKLRHSRLISGIILFVGSFALMFTSLGAGLVIYSVASVLCFIISLSKLSNILRIVLIPFLSPAFYFKLILQVMNQDTPLNLIKLWKNNYIVLFIYPAIILLCCQKN